MIITKDAVVVGAGASGLFAAAEAGRRGRDVIVLERTATFGNKIRVSGGGRCNFTNLHVTADNYISQNPRFCLSALSSFTPHDFIQIAESYGVSYYEKEHGQLFCKGSSGQIIAMVRQLCEDNNVRIIYNAKIHDISKRGDVFVIVTDSGIYHSVSLCIATGGISYPQLGATPFGYRVAAQFGLNVIPTRPALVPLVFSAEDSTNFAGLAGISIEAAVSCNKKYFQGGVLFTRRGLSGPPILQVSSYWRPGDSISIDLFAGAAAYEFLQSRRRHKAALSAILSEAFPKNFARTWCEVYSYVRPVNQFNEKELREIAARLHNWQIFPEKTEGYKRAEAVTGGVDAGELSSKTMEAKKVRRLYFTGEVIDVTGQLGGYNLHWAWASGSACGRHM
ncbi:MAG: NAD(P)/FAD-dependent oxidoreductase [Candidatus Magnetominusculus sp. LBB02]|nr:NAD(P)/FAD-dependent oxidoreductase [Candidatus Magnetominusculus sp. LBB02]